MPAARVVQQVSEIYHGPVRPVATATGHPQRLADGPAEAVSLAAGPAAEGLRISRASRVSRGAAACRCTLSLMARAPSHWQQASSPASRLRLLPLSNRRSQGGISHPGTFQARPRSGLAGRLIEGARMLAARFDQKQKVGATGYVHAQREVEHWLLRLGSALRGHLRLCGLGFGGRSLRFHRRFLRELLGRGVLLL